MTVVESLNKWFPNATEEQHHTLVWNTTAYPAGGAELVDEQLKRLQSSPCQSCRDSRIAWTVTLVRSLSEWIASWQSSGPSRILIRVVGGLRDIEGIAVSGGVDSMALLSFMRYGKHRPDAYFYHHNTEDSEKAFRFLLDYCRSHRITLHVEKLVVERPQGDSQKSSGEMSGTAGFIPSLQPSLLRTISMT